MKGLVSMVSAATTDMDKQLEEWFLAARQGRHGCASIGGSMGHAVSETVAAIVMLTMVTRVEEMDTVMKEDTE